MPGLLTRFVHEDSTGGDGTTRALTGANAAYSTFQTFFALDLALPTLDVIAECVVIKENYTSASEFNLSGWTTDLTRYVYVHGDYAIGSAHGDFRIASTRGSAWAYRPLGNTAHFANLIIDETSRGGTNGFMIVGGGTGVRATWEDVEFLNGSASLFIRVDTANTRMINCAIRDCPVTTQWLRENTTAATTLEIIHCIWINVGAGTSATWDIFGSGRAAGSVQIKNTYSDNPAGLIILRPATDAAYDIDEFVTENTEGDRGSVATTAFVDPANGNYRPVRDGACDRTSPNLSGNSPPVTRDMDNRQRAEGDVSVGPEKESQTATYSIKDAPRWDQPGNAQLLSTRKTGESQRWVATLVAYKGSHVDANQIPGHTVSFAGGTAPEYDRISQTDDKGGHRFDYALTWGSGLVTAATLSFANGGGPSAAIASPASDQVVDDIVAAPFLCAYNPTDDKIFPADQQQLVRDSLLSLVSTASWGGDRFSGQEYRVPGWTTAINGPAAAPTSITLVRQSAIDGPDFTWEHTYTEDLLIETAKLSIRRKASEAVRVQEHWEWLRQPNGDIISCRSKLDATAGTSTPPARFGLTRVVTIAPNFLESGSLHDWNRPADNGNPIEEWTRAVLYSHIETIANQGFGGSDPLMYLLPRMTAGHWFVRFFYDPTSANGAGVGTGKPNAVEATLAGVMLRWEHVYVAGNLTQTAHFMDHGFGKMRRRGVTTPPDPS